MVHLKYPILKIWCCHKHINYCLLQGWNLTQSWGKWSQTIWQHSSAQVILAGKTHDHGGGDFATKKSQKLGYKIRDPWGGRIGPVIGGNLFSLREWLVPSYGARLFGNTFLNFLSNFSLEGGNWLICLWQHHISKMGYFKCTILFNICTISFLSYHDIGWTMFT